MDLPQHSTRQSILDCPAFPAPNPPHRRPLRLQKRTVSYPPRLLIFHPAMAAAVETRTDPAVDIVQQVLDPSLAAKQYDFSFSDFLKREYRFGLAPNRPVCKAFREGHSPLGTSCPDRHQAVHSLNNLVCKHWLRGLCKKGDQCEFLHEYNV